MEGADKMIEKLELRKVDKHDTIKLADKINEIISALQEQEKPKEEQKFNPQSMDAVVWAKEFMRLYNNNKLRPINIPDWVDEDTMRGWFANAIMAGYDEARRRYEKPNEEVGYGELYPTVFHYLQQEPMALNIIADLLTSALLTHFKIIKK